MIESETVHREGFHDEAHVATCSIHIRKPGRRDSADDDTPPSSRRSSDTGDDDKDEISGVDTEDEEHPGKRRGVHIACTNMALTAWARKLRETFGLPFLLLVGTVYFVQGFNSFSSFALGYLIKDVMKLQPAESQAVMTASMIPWGIKPIYGILSDSLPLCGYRRKSYLVIMNMCGIAAFYGLYSVTSDSSVGFLMLILVCSSATAAVSDVIIDALVVERARLDPKNGANDLQSLTWCMMSLGGIIGSLLAGPTTSHLGPNMVFLFASSGPITLFFLSCSMAEARAVAVAGKSCCHTAREQVTLLCSALRVPVVWRAALFLFTATAISPSFGQIQFYFVTEELHFSEEFLGNMNALGFVFLMVGTITYNTWFKDVPFRTMFFYAHIGLALVSFAEVLLVTRRNLQLGIPDKWFVIGDAIISDIISRMKTMPLLVLCAKLCPKGIEGTFFALLMSITNMAWSTSSFWGASLCAALGIARNSYANLWIAIVVRSVMKLVPLLFLSLLPMIDPQEEVDAMTTGSQTDVEELESPVEDDSFLPQKIAS
ncbi:Aste57867_2140 [Aphanomyces stellatus]|uniref:Aste57867_2140 protein n=1 Tax=Aphanomyces stellatus TaxID=120398 RepID=A0A485K7X9_9STRA|nr:hypothetical protein As57867_002135 [Aphanomyces stellatus]VFT79343.1 Aste57867_2140 [Aphanomyces stellatus]